MQVFNVSNDAVRDEPNANGRLPGCGHCQISIVLLHEQCLLYSGIWHQVQTGANLHGVTTQKELVFVSTAVTTWHLTQYITSHLPCQRGPALMCDSCLGYIQMASYLRYLRSSITLWTNTVMILHNCFIPYCFDSVFISTQPRDISRYVY